MGRLMGAFDSDELDRPDLNKCIDCGCFFEGDNCPLCGKPCVEEYKAGNRKPVKQKKKKGSTSSRVTFIPWYHSWWFIILSYFFMPLLSIILFATAPYKKGLKIAVVCVMIALALLYTFGLGALSSLLFPEEAPVDTSLSQYEYMEKCEECTADAFYRSPSSYEDRFVKMDLQVVSRFVDGEALDSDKYSVYYVCSSLEDSGVQIILRDCTESGRNLVGGDRITVYGEGAGSAAIYDLNYTAHEGACLNGAYIEIN